MLKSGDSVALVLDSAPRTWTSQEDIHLRLGQALRDRGIKLVLVFADSIKEDLAQRFRDVGVQIEIANYRVGRLDYFQKLRAIVARHSIALIHVCFFDYFSAVPWLARFSGTKKILFEQLNSGELSAKSWKRQLIRWRGALATGAARRVVAISHFVKDQLAECGVPEEKIIVRHLGVDTDRFKPNADARTVWEARFGIGSEEIIISTISVLRPFKNPETILKACGILAERLVPFRLLVAGDGEMLSELKALVQDMNISDRVHWIGYSLDPKSLLQASDIFVLGSTGEAFGLVLAEAMACGVPVVGSRSGAIPEIVEDRITGLLATPRDEVSFANALERLVVDGQARREMGANSFRRTQQQFTVDKSVAGTLAIYDSM